MTANKIHIAFDLYGTLLDTSSIAGLLQKTYGDKAKPIAAQWRRYQLEYTWRLNSLNVYEPFSDVTRRALKHAVREAGEKTSDETEDTFMKAYDSLNVFGDVVSALESVSALSKDKINSVIFSNGTRKMIEASIQGSPSLSTMRSLFSKTVLIDEIPSSVRKYKPSPVTYQYLVDELDANPQDVWLVTSNPFDVDGGKRFGLRVCWVDRQGLGWIDGLGADPDFVCSSLGEVVATIGKEST